MTECRTADSLAKPGVDEILAHVVEHREVKVSAVAELPTRFGDFQVVAFHAPAETGEHVVLVHALEQIDCVHRTCNEPSQRMTSDVA